MVFLPLSEFRSLGELQDSAFPLPPLPLPLPPRGLPSTSLEVLPLSGSRHPSLSLPAPGSWWVKVRAALEPPLIFHLALALVVPLSTEMQLNLLGM